MEHGEWVGLGCVRVYLEHSCSVEFEPLDSVVRMSYAFMRLFPSLAVMRNDEMVDLIETSELPRTIRGIFLLPPKTPFNPSPYPSKHSR